MKTVLSTFAAAAFLFASGAILFGALLSPWFRHNMGHIVRGPDDFRMLPVMLEKLVQGLFLSVVYTWLPRRGSAAADGLRFGVIMGLLLELPFALSLHGNYPVGLGLASSLGAIDFVRIVIAGLLIGLIQARRTDPDQPEIRGAMSTSRAA